MRGFALLVVMVGASVAEAQPKPKAVEGATEVIRRRDRLSTTHGGGRRSFRIRGFRYVEQSELRIVTLATKAEQIVDISRRDVASDRDQLVGQQAFVVGEMEAASRCRAGRAGQKNRSRPARR
jgi:hypothetical protein